MKKDGGEFDQFTGATITPRAVVNAVVKRAGLVMPKRCPRNQQSSGLWGAIMSQVKEVTSRVVEQQLRLRSLGDAPLLAVTSIATNALRSGLANHAGADPD